MSTNTKFLTLCAICLPFALSACSPLSENVITDIHGNTTTKHGRP